MKNLLSYESINHNFIGLSNPVGPRECLDIVVGVPVWIVDNHGIRSCQVDSQTPSSERNNIHEKRTYNNTSRLGIVYLKNKPFILNSNQENKLSQ